MFGYAFGRPTKPRNVAPQEKEKVVMPARRPKSAQAIAMSARIVLACVQGLSSDTALRSYTSLWYEGRRRTRFPLPGVGVGGWPSLSLSVTLQKP
jgi:hypothetical protein